MAEKKSKPKPKKKSEAVWTSGRRKTAVARVKLTFQGEGRVVVNNQPLAEYFPSEPDQQALLEPLRIAGHQPDSLDISIKAQGGGKKAQQAAAILGLAKAMVELDSAQRPALKAKGFLTRDPRMKERKKYGLRRARKAPQYSKR